MNLEMMSLNSITIKRASFTELVHLAESHGIRGIAPWRDLFDDFPIEKASSLVQASGLRVSSLCRGGMFTAPDQVGRDAAIADNRRAIEQAAALGAETLVLVCGPVIERDVLGSQQMVVDGIAAILDYAEAHDVRLSIEPLHPMMASSRSTITLLSQTRRILEELRHPLLGVCLDAYHVWWDPMFTEEIVLLGPLIQDFHVSDWVTPIQGELSSRGLMGDGCIDLRTMREHVYAQGYNGLTEVEILSDDWWAVDPAEFVPIIAQRFVEYV